MSAAAKVRQAKCKSNYVKVHSKIVRKKLKKYNSENSTIPDNLGITEVVIFLINR